MTAGDPAKEQQRIIAVCHFFVAVMKTAMKSIVLVN
jgi:hypothetical protein